jgi:hypothetical protein
LLLKFNNFTKNLSIIFNILENILLFIKSLSNYKTINFMLVPLLSTCTHGLVTGCALCTEVIANTQVNTQANTQAAAQAIIGACTHD